MQTTTKQKIAFNVLFLCTLVVILPVLFVLFIVVKNGWSALNWQFISAMPRAGMREGGIYPAIMGTIYLVSLSLLFSLPLGLGAAIYLNEYSKDNWLIGREN